MSKKLIIVTAAAGLVSFAGAFAFSWLTKKAPAGPSSEPNQPSLAKQEFELNLPKPIGDAVGAPATDDGTTKQAMTERQLKYLVYEVQEKMRQYNAKLASLDTRERRMQMAQDGLKKDIESLNNLRIELATIVAGVKEERDKLLKSRIEIAQAEKVNMVKIAATYDKMDSASAGKILSSMCNAQTQGGAATGSAGPAAARYAETSNMDDAVKILHYMTERTKAKVLAELVTSEPKLAALLCEKLKQVVEK